MARKNYTAEQIIGMLREAEVRLSGGEKRERYVADWVSQNRAIIAGGVNMAV